MNTPENLAIKKSVIIHNNSSSVYDQQAGKLILDYLTIKDKSKMERLVKFIKESGQSFDDFNCVFYLNHDYKRPDTKYNSKALIYRANIEQAYNDALQGDDESPNFIRIWKQDGVTHYMASPEFDLFGGYVGDMYEEDGSLKKEVISLSVRELKNSLTPIHSFQTGGDISSVEIQYGDYVNFTKDSDEKTPNGNPLYRKGAGGNVSDIIKKDGKVFYTIQKGLSNYYNVPASDIVLYKKDVREKVDKILTEKQLHKEHKDIGSRVSGSQKEKIVLRGNMVSMDDLSALEEDELTAMKMVVKEKVYPEVNIEEQKQNGVSAGATFIKVETRKACGNAPPNKKQNRASYIKFINKFSEDTLNLKTVEEIKQVYQSYLKWTATEVLAYFFDTEFLNYSDEVKAKTQALFDTRFRYGGSIVVKQVVTELFGKRLSNFMFQGSDTAYATWREAYSYEPISKELSEMLVLAYKEQKQKFIDANQKKVNEYTSYSEPELQKALVDNWSFVPMIKKEYKKNIEQFREYAVKYYTRKVNSGIEDINKIPENILQRENNWSWYETSPEKREVERSNEIQINSGKPLAYIKRKNGVVISEEYLNKTKDSDLQKNPITGDFGFKSVQFGQSINDRASKEHIRHFLGAMSDLSEMLDISISELNKVAGLSIAFASRGKRGALAHYESGRKIINLTNKRGDGTVNHEYFHYIDNITMSITQQGIGLDFGSDDPSKIQNPIIAESMKEIMNFIYKGNSETNKPVKVLFKKSNRVYTSIPSFYSRKLNKSKQITLMPTIEETIEVLRSEFKDVVSADTQYPEYQISTLGYIINHFGLNEYEVPLSINTSNFFYNSKRFSSAYWIKPRELFARASETYMFDKLKKSGRYNNYLVNEEMFSETLLKDGTFTNPYPMGVERDILFDLFENLIKNIKKEYNLSGFKPVSDKREDEYLVLEENETINENVDTGIVVDAKNDEPKEVIHDNKIVTPEPPEPKVVKMTKSDYEDALDGAKTMLEFMEGTEKQEQLDYIESLETMISLFE